MQLFGRISRADGTSRQVQAMAATYRAAESLIQQQVEPNEALLFVWGTAFGAPARSGTGRPFTVVTDQRRSLTYRGTAASRARYS